MSKIFETRISEDPETFNTEVRTEIHLGVSTEISRSDIARSNIRLGEIVRKRELYNIRDLKDILYGDIENQLFNLRETVIQMVPSTLKDRLMAQIRDVLEKLDAFEEREI